MPKRSIDILVYNQRPATGTLVVNGVGDYGMSHGGWRMSMYSILNPMLRTILKASLSEGVIISAQTSEQARELANIGKPIVNVLSVLPPGTMPSVVFDDQAAGTMGARHLLDRGLSHFAYVGIDARPSHNREESYVKELLAHDKSCIIGGPNPQTPGSMERWTWRNVEDGKTLRDWVTTLPRPIGVFCFNDMLAALVIEACMQLKLRVPEEVAVLGVDNDELLCRYAPIPVSSVDPDYYQIGYQSAALLDRLISGARPPKRPVVVPPTEIVIRRSTDMFAINDAELRNALHFIREHACDPIDVEQVLEHVMISRASLDRRFLAALGRTPSQEIRRVRLAESQRLLRETTLPAATIASRCGFASQQHLCRFFKEKLGISPGAFRKKSSRTI